MCIKSGQYDPRLMLADTASIRFNKKKKMAKNNLREAMYALPGGEVTPHKKPIAMPLLILLAGVAMLLVNGYVLTGADISNLKSALMQFGAVFVIVGGVIAVARLAGVSTRPYYKKDGCFLRHEELKFKKEQKHSVLELLSKGDFTNLRQIPSDGVSAVVVEIYSSPKSGFTVAQAFEYVDFEQRPASEMKIVE